MADRAAATLGQEMRQTLGRVQLGPARPAAEVVLDDRLNCHRLLLGQRIDEQLLPPPKPQSLWFLPTPAEYARPYSSRPRLDVLPEPHGVTRLLVSGSAVSTSKP
jgi:hypothetical protein